jgi:hypothetical protein
MKRTKFHRALIVPALAVLAAQPLLAQTSERNAPASQQPSQDQDGADARAKLNAQQAQFAQTQLAGNSMSQEEYQRQLQAVEDAKAKIAADAAAAQQAYEAEKARRDAEYKAAMDKWQADVDACKAGDHTRCAAPATPPA